ncbi:MAG: hypothetical protein QXM48_04370 [Sulfolobales archaeon]
MLNERITTLINMNRFHHIVIPKDVVVWNFQSTTKAGSEGLSSLM